MINPEIVNSAYQSFVEGTIDRETFTEIAMSNARSLVRYYAKRETQEDINDIAVDSILEAMKQEMVDFNFFAMLARCVKLRMLKWGEEQSSKKAGSLIPHVSIESAWRELVVDGAGEMETIMQERELRDRLEKLPEKSREALNKRLEGKTLTNAEKSAATYGIKKLKELMRK